MATRKLPDTNEVVENKEVKTKKTTVKGVVVNCSSLNIRKEANMTSEIVDVLPVGTTVNVLETLDGWYRINKGFISGSFVELK